jgi:hypothetical protein
MPGRKKSSASRVRRFRARKKIAALRKDAGFALWGTQTFFREHDIALTSWVRADEIHGAPISVQNIRLSELVPGLDNFIKILKNEPAIETANMACRTENVLILRPRYLGSEVLP